MAETALVDIQVKDGQRLLARLAREGAPVVAAAWVKESDSGDWYLYLATPLLEEAEGKRAAYHMVNEVIRAMQDEGFGMDPFAKKVVASNDAMVRDLIAHRAAHPGGPLTLYRGSRLGSLSIDEAYIYPPVATAG